MSTSAAYTKRLIAQLQGIMREKEWGDSLMYAERIHVIKSQSFEITLIMLIQEVRETCEF